MCGASTPVKLSVGTFAFAFLHLRYGLRPPRPWHHTAAAAAASAAAAGNPLSPPRGEQLLHKHVRV